jgi:hypothetical protein
MSQQIVETAFEGHWNKNFRLAADTGPYLIVSFQPEAGLLGDVVNSRYRISEQS